MKKYDWEFLEATVLTLLACLGAWAAWEILSHYFNVIVAVCVIGVALMVILWWIDRPKNPDCPYCEHDHEPVKSKDECPWSY